MKFAIEGAQLRVDPEEGYVGQVRFRVEGHPKAYEITLFSEKGKAWDYGLHFADESGSEELIDAVEAFLEEDDDAFDALVEAALAAKDQA
ncbi:hypothetical protein [Paenibacillus sp.]|uniref:hypothetical protein n=1 Tax=Paenibacillus sp. TaxID=58172 RepID=UPI002D3073D9|nr:hypothetical protein [Paenibacillus sp.]HZG56746.1 hypothetical protein [Paenibacillus sp.]